MFFFDGIVDILLMRSSLFVKKILQRWYSRVSVRAEHFSTWSVLSLFIDVHVLIQTFAASTHPASLNAFYRSFYTKVNIFFSKIALQRFSIAFNPLIFTDFRDFQKYRLKVVIASRYFFNLSPIRKHFTSYIFYIARIKAIIERLSKVLLRMRLFSTPYLLKHSPLSVCSACPIANCNTIGLLLLSFFKIFLHVRSPAGSRTCTSLLLICAVSICLKWLINTLFVRIIC